jgi:SOS-response transcriptional repressor LexA
MTRVLEERGWSLTQLAERIGYELRTLKRVQSGEVPVSDKLQKRLNKVLEEPSKNGKQVVSTEMEHADRSPGGARGRLRYLREKRELSVQELAKLSRVSMGTIRNLEEGHTGAQEKELKALASALGVDPEIFLEGSDSPRLTGAGRTYGAEADMITGPGLVARTIPLLSWAEAGELKQWDDVYEHDGFVAFNVKDPKAVALKIRGDSMSPEYPDGTVAIIYPSFEPKNGDLIIARLRDGSVLFKRLQLSGDQFIFVSLNTVYPPMPVEKKEVERLMRVGATYRSED